ncbi:MAG: hypothetical protein KDD58_15885, partial [Bdellovibrionales bacterium]|nr:hypothetical protein [Bdellovibrionales bacterium]
MIKKIIKIVIISSIFSFFSTSLLAANVYKVRGKNVILLDKNRELKAGESYQLVDSAEKVRGKIKVLKVKGQKVFAKVISGQARKNFRTQYQDDFSSGFNDSSTVKGDKALRGYFGFVMGSDADSMPFVFGGDYLMPFQKNINLKMGGLYWFYSESGIDVSLLELSGGAYYYHSLSNKMLL